MKRQGCLFRSLALLLLFLVMIAAGLWYVYQSAQQMPEFYAAALNVDTQRYEVAGDEFESQVVQLSNDLRQAGLWEATFTEEQINGWLATDLPQKFPKALPQQAKNPRISITPEQLVLAFKLESPRLQGIVICESTVYCTENPNELAIRFDRVRSGVVTLPIAQWMDQIAEGLQKAKIQMEWTEEDGRPVALVTLPDAEMADGDVIVDSIELGEAQVTIRGHTLNGTEPFGLDDLPGQNQ